MRRAIDDPKPLYYQDTFLDAKLAEYLGEAELQDPSDIVPDEFVRWIFPALVAHRRPKYEALADRYGYTLSARLAEAINGRAGLSRLHRERARLTVDQPTVIRPTQGPTPKPLRASGPRSRRRCFASGAAPVIATSANRASSNPQPKPETKPARCANTSVFSPPVPVNASKPSPAMMGAIRDRHGVSLRKPRRHVYAVRIPSAAKTAVDAPIERCCGACTSAFTALANVADPRIASQPTPGPR